MKTRTLVHGEKHDGYLWGIERKSDTPERIVHIYNALVKLNLPPNFSIIDIAGGRGVVLNGIAGLFLECRPVILDIVNYEYDWAKFRHQVKKIVMPLQDFIKKDKTVFDVVMMLNSYRNWKEDKKRGTNVKEAFDTWLVEHARYFITSGAIFPYEQGEIDGFDYKGKLQLFKLPLSYK